MSKAVFKASSLRTGRRIYRRSGVTGMKSWKVRRCAPHLVHLHFRKHPVHCSAYHVFNGTPVRLRTFLNIARSCPRALALSVSSGETARVDLSSLTFFAYCL